jgi:hypothetical protein
MAPYRLQVYFGQPNGNLQLIVTANKAIDPQFPDGKNGFLNGAAFIDITVNNAVISINNELLRGHYENKFRFQHNHFELIGHSSVYSDGQSIITTTDFNLSTGIQVETKERYDIDKVVSIKKKKIFIRPLPKLQDFTPFDSELY